MTKGLEGAGMRALALLCIGLGCSKLGRAQPTRTFYEAAHTAEKRLRRSEDLGAQKSEWLRIAGLYRNLELDHSGCRECDDALRSEAEIQLEIYRRFRDREAIQKALDAYRLLVSRYPSSRWAPKAYLARGRIYLDDLGDPESARGALRPLLERWPASPEGRAARRLLEDLENESLIPTPASAGPVSIGELRHWSGRGYSRIVVELSRESIYRHGRFETAGRFYVDVLDAELDNELLGRTLTLPTPSSPIRVELVRPRSGVARLVLQVPGLGEYRVFALPDPHRLVVEVTYGEATSAAAEPILASLAETGPLALTQTNVTEVAGTSAPEEAPGPPLPKEAVLASEMRVPTAPTGDGYPLTRQLGLAVRRIIVDPGHGGHDPGTTGPDGLVEKNLTLEISQLLVELLGNGSGLKVVLTRESDVFVPLEDRTAMGNAHEADLFVSVHINSSRRPDVRGVETYYLDFASEPQAEEVAVRENAATTRRFAELRLLLEGVLSASRSRESQELARHVQRAMASELHEPPVGELYAGVRTAPFRVLVGASMPAVLIEAGYLSNREDAAQLALPSFRRRIAEAIARGVRSYLGALNGGAAPPAIPPESR